MSRVRSWLVRSLWCFAGWVVAASVSAAPPTACQSQIQFIGGSWSLLCQSPCGGGCTVMGEQFEYGVFRTCTCNGAFPICCHVGYQSDGGGGWTVDASGACKAQQSACPAGNTCTIDIDWINENDFEVDPSCINQ